MGTKTYTWVKADHVAWSDSWEFVRGWKDGIPLLPFHHARRDRLATRRQLRAMGLRPGGQDVAALLYFRHRASQRQVFAELFLIAKAEPVRPMTPAKRAALAKALAARRTCRDCGQTGYAELPRAHRTCEGCRAPVEVLDPVSYLHDYLIGEPTLSAGEHTVLDTELRAQRGATVTAIHPRAVTAPETEPKEVAA